MSEQTPKKGNPNFGAKKAPTSNVYKAPTSKEKNHVIFELIDRSNDPLRPFRPLHIASSKDFIYDPETETERTIRYLSGSSSIFADEQNVDPEFTKAGDIEFHRGRLIVPKTQVSLLKFLRATNQNEANKNRNTNKPPVFRELNIEKEAEDSFDIILGRRKAVEAAWYDVDNNLEAMYHYARVLGIDTSKLNEKQVINKYIDIAEKKPELFLKFHKSPRNEFKYFAMTALDKNVVSSRDVAGQIVWCDTKGLITILPAGKDAADYLADFLMATENQKTFEELKEKVLELSK